ncbi:MAG: T9SS type A sorting domain-containing protein [Flavobacteriales bacterium]
MKKLILSSLFTMAYFVSTAQSCTPGANFVDSTYGVWPDTTQNFPSADPNVFYSTDLNFKVPDSVTPAIDPSGAFVGSVIQQFTVSDVIGLPPGYNYACNVSNCTYLGGSNGCANIYGTTDTVGVFPITIEVTATVLISLFPGLPPTPVTQAVTFDGYHIMVGTNGQIVICYGFGPINVAPNPASELLTISGYVPSNETIVSIQDLSGKTFESTNANQLELNFDLSRLKSGSYIVVVNDAFGTRTQKFVKL